LGRIFTERRKNKLKKGNILVQYSFLYFPEKNGKIFSLHGDFDFSLVAFLKLFRQVLKTFCRNRYFDFDKCLLGMLANEATSSEN
jgi:hypothetical protein